MRTTRESNQLLKVEVLSHYGNGKLACIQCGEERLNCLTLDHLNNDGYKSKTSRSGISLYRYLRANNFPVEYQTLCMNCNMIKALQLKMSTPDTVILSFRVSGQFYYEVMKRADLKKTNITDYVKNALTKYMGYTEGKDKEK